MLIFLYYNKQTLKQKKSTLVEIQIISVQYLRVYFYHTFLSLVSCPSIVNCGNSASSTPRTGVSFQYITTSDTVYPSATTNILR